MIVKKIFLNMKLKSPKGFRRLNVKYLSSAAQSSKPDTGYTKKYPDAKSNTTKKQTTAKKNSLKNFYIFRHGECPLNVSGHIQGQTIDGKLTPTGRRQIHTTGHLLKPKNIEVIISSPLKRALQSALIVSLYTQSHIFKDDRLKEVNMGIVEGMHINDVIKKYKDIYAKWQNCTLSDTTTKFENGETKAEVRKRIFAALNEYAENTPFHNIGISAHGITISQTLLAFNIPKNDITNGSILHLSYHNKHWKYIGFLKNNIFTNKHPSYGRCLSASYNYNKGKKHAENNLWI